MEKKFIVLIAAGAVLAAILSGLWFYQQYPASNQQVESNNTKETINAKNNNLSPDSGVTAARGTAISYTEAVNQYKGRIIQFDSNCAVNPSYATFKVGAQIMLDNRSNKNLPVALDSQQYNLKAYDFKIISLATSSKLPHTMMIDCGTGQNNARILLQQ